MEQIRGLPQGEAGDAVIPDQMTHGGAPPMTFTIQTRAAPQQSAVRCRHQPPCPAATKPDALAAVIVAAHPEQGWYLLCNGVITFDDSGAIIGTRVVAPRRVRHAAATCASTA